MLTGVTSKEQVTPRNFLPNAWHRLCCPIAVETVFKRHFWLVHFAFILAAAFLVMRVVSAYIEVQISPEPRSFVAPLAATNAPAAAKISMQALAELLGLPRPDPDPMPPKNPGKDADFTSEPVHTALRLKLLGTLLSDTEPRASVATILDVDTSRTQTYVVQSKVRDAEVLNILRTRVIVLNNSRREFIDAVPGDGAGSPLTPPLPSEIPPPRVAPTLGAGLKQVSENKYELPRADLDKTLANLNDLAVQARIVPAFKDGQSTGFRLFSIQPDSLYAKMGVQNGDVIRRINGFDINSPEKALEIYSKLKETTRLDVDIDRNGNNVTKTYNIQ